MGSTHHALEDYGVLLTLSAMQVVIPAFDNDLSTLIPALFESESPTYLRLGLGEQPKAWTTPPFSPWRKLVSGEGGTLIAIGPLAGSLWAACAEKPESTRPNLWCLSQLPLSKLPEELFSLLFALPWAWFDRSRRSWFFCSLLIAILGIGWQLNVPGLVSLWRLPGLRMLTPGRMVFATAWATLTLAAIGLEQFCKSFNGPRSRVLHIAVVVTVGCWLCCFAGLFAWPDKLRTFFPQGQQGLSLTRIQSSFQTAYLLQLGWLSCVLIIWFLTLRRLFPASRLTPLVCLLMILEPFSHCWKLHPQPDPKLYYPRLPALEFIQRSAPGRVLGVECLPPKVLESHQLRDIRGYDGVDPLAYIQLLSLSYDQQRTSAPEYARTMWYFPEFREPATHGTSFQLHPILNMLGLRYIVCDESVGIPNPVFQGGGYKVYLNENALPRAWIPQHAERLPSSDAILQSMRDWSFDPAQRAYTLESTAGFPDGGSGSVELIRV